MISLENLIDHQYAHLGWMTIAYKSEKYDEIFAYMNFNMDLIAKIKEKMKTAKNSEIKRELEGLVLKMDHLENIANSLFNYETVKNNLCNKTLHIHKEPSTSVPSIHKESSLPIILDKNK
jgi:hypothetical protein